MRTLYSTGLTSQSAFSTGNVARVTSEPEIDANEARDSGANEQYSPLHPCVERITSSFVVVHSSRLLVTQNSSTSRACRSS